MDVVLVWIVMGCGVARCTWRQSHREGIHRHLPPSRLPRAHINTPPPLLPPSPPQVMVPVQEAFSNPLPPLPPPSGGGGSGKSPPPPGFGAGAELVTICGMEDNILVGRGGGGPGRE